MIMLTTVTQTPILNEDELLVGYELTDYINEAIEGELEALLANNE